MLFQSTSCEEYLQTELIRRMRTNPLYSQRAFARQLGMSPGELSEILRGKRKMSFKNARKVSEYLRFSEPESDHWLRLAAGEPVPLRLKGEASLSVDMFSLVSEWYCLSVLPLLECEGAQSNEKWIAEKLGISPLEARFALERLIRVGLVEKKGDELVPVKDVVFSPDGVPSEAVRSFHRQMLQKAGESLDNEPMERREISGVTLSVSPDDRAKLKREVSKFLESLLQKYGSPENPQEVYQVELALFPLTK